MAVLEVARLNTAAHQRQPSRCQINLDLMADFQESSPCHTMGQPTTQQDRLVGLRHRAEEPLEAMAALAVWQALAAVVGLDRQGGAI